MPKTPRTDGRPSAPVSPLRAILSTTAVLIGGIVLAATAATGTYALWNDTAPVNGGTISSGSSALTIDNAANVTVNLTGTALLPGRSVVQATPLQFKNVGVTPLNVTAASIVVTPVTLAPHLQISLRPAVAATCTVTPETTPLPASIAPISFTEGQTRPMCLEVRLLTSAPASMQGVSAAFTVNLTVAQVRP